MSGAGLRFQSPAQAMALSVKNLDAANDERRSNSKARTKRNWRRTSFKRLDGTIDVAPDNWTLLDAAGR